jgi:RNA polymerase sigma-70 factor, ECF subfamily
MVARASARYHRGVSGLIGILRAARGGGEVSDTLEPALVACVDRARAAWPEVRIEPELFITAIARYLPGDREPAEGLGTLHVEDLYLATACAAGEPAALAAFERTCGPVIAHAIVAAGATSAERADLEQVVRQRLLVAPADDATPRIASYSARGTLGSWVRVVATREAARMLPRARREVSAEDEELATLIVGDDDPEIGYLKRLYRHEFKLAFDAAVHALGDRERLVLRQRVLDGLSIDQLAALHGVHRATAARWVEAARDAVVAATQRELIRRLGLSRDEVASVMRLIRSQLDVSLPRLLGTTTGSTT